MASTLLTPPPINNLGNLLNNRSIAINEYDNRGVYTLTCKDCDKQYKSQTNRSFAQRFRGTFTIPQKKLA